MVFLNQQNIIPSFSLIEHPLGKPALRKQAVQHLISWESRAQLSRLFYLFLQFIIDRRIYRLIVVLALAGEYLLLLVIYRHHIDLRIAVDATRPVGANAGRREVHRLVPAQGGKDILADVLVGEGNEFLDIDGNKRIGAHAMLVFLAVNGVELTYTQTQLSDIILQVAADEKDYPDLLDWLLCHQN